MLPFLQVLGFDIYDPTEVKPEYIADFAKKKSGGQFEKIDYAITLKGESAIFVECKAVDVAVEDHDGQLARYFNSTPSVKLGVLATGIQYRFFTDVRLGNRPRIKIQRWQDGPGPQLRLKPAREVGHDLIRRGIAKASA